MSITKDKSVAELLALQDEISDALSRARAERIDALRASVRELAEDDGMSFEAFVQANLLNAKPVRADKPRRNVVPPKYANPDDASVTWSGKGKAPAWFSKALRQGYDRETLEIGRVPGVMVAQ